MTGKTIGIALAAVVVAFGAAFAIGSATKSKDSSTSAPSPVKSFKPDAAQTQLAAYQPSGALPAPKKEQKRKPARKSTGGGGGGGGGSAPTPTPTPGPAPAPRPSPAPAPRPPSGGGGAGGGD
jgi:hypothetical protein